MRDAGSSYTQSRLYRWAENRWWELLFKLIRPGALVRKGLGLVCLNVSGSRQPGVQGSICWFIARHALSAAARIGRCAGGVTIAQLIAPRLIHVSLDASKT